ncbi:5'-nucleotidase C-terminal domain-containing protein [Vibrio harveyi]|nr:5'-nucleotidase C-terminal domain-containing protein [Vibrio harveyi]
MDSVNYSEDNVIGLINGGGLRQDIAVGNVKKLDLLGVSPFGNRITAVKVKGSTLIKAVKHGASKVFSGGYAQYSSNVKANINITKADGNNRVYELDESSLKINDKPINKEQEYVIVTNDFLLIGGDGYTMLDYTKNPNDVKHVYEGNDLLQVYIDYGKHITTNQEVKDGNLFEKRKIQDYNPDIYPQNIIVNHKLNK